MTQQNVSKRNISIDLLKLTMAGMVVGLHGGFLVDVVPSASHFITQALFRVAVPTFFIITGFYLETSIEKHGAAWFKRIAAMFFLWTAIYSVFWLDPSGFEPKELVMNVAAGYFHLWYLVALFWGAVVLLIVQSLKASSRVLLACCLSAFGLGTLIQYAGNWHVLGDPWWDSFLNNYHLYRNAVFFAFPFLAMGVLLSRHEGRLDSWRSLLPFALFGGFVLLAAEWAFSFYFITREVFDIYASLVVVCPLLFLFVRKLSVPSANGTIALLATCIFLLHPMAQMVLAKHARVGGTLLTLASLGISAGLAPIVIWLNRRLPLL